MELGAGRDWTRMDEPSHAGRVLARQEFTVMSAGPRPPWLAHPALRLAPQAGIPPGAGPRLTRSTHVRAPRRPGGGPLRTRSRRPPSSRVGRCVFPRYVDVRLSVVISDSAHTSHQEDICSADM